MTVRSPRLAALIVPTLIVVAALAIAPHTATAQDDSYVDLVMLYEYQTDEDVEYSVQNNGTATATGVSVSFLLEDLQTDDSFTFAASTIPPIITDKETVGTTTQRFTWVIGNIPPGSASEKLVFRTSLHSGHTSTGRIGSIRAEASSFSPEPDVLLDNNVKKFYSYADTTSGASLHMRRNWLALLLSVDDLRPAAGGDVNFGLTAYNAQGGGGDTINLIADAKVKVELSDGLEFKSGWTPPSTFVKSDSQSATWSPPDTDVRGSDDTFPRSQEIGIQTQLTSDTLADIPLKDRCITARVEDSKPPPSPRYFLSSLTECLGDDPPVLLEEGSVAFLTSFPCIDDSHTDAHQCESVPGVAVAARLPSRHSDYVESDDFQTNLISQGVGRTDEYVGTNRTVFLDPESVFIQVKDPEGRVQDSNTNRVAALSWQTARDAHADIGNRSVEGVAITYTRKDVTDATAWNSLGPRTLTVSGLDGGSPPGGVKIRLNTSRNTFFDLASSTSVTKNAFNITTVSNSVVRYFAEFETLGTYVIKYDLTMTASSTTEYTDTGTYTFHVGPVAELEVRDDGAGQVPAGTRGFTIVAVNNGPDDAPAAQVTVTGLNASDYVSHSATKGTFATSTGIWVIGELITKDVSQITSGRDGEVLTIITSAAVDTEITAAITNTLDYQVCIDSSGNDVDLTSPSESACTNASSTNTWHTTDYYDYDPGNSTTTIKAKDGTGADLPSLRSAQEDTASIVVTWEAVTEVNGRGVTHYEVQRETSPWVTVAENVVDTRYVDTDVNAGDTFQYRVRAVNDRDHKGPWSAPMEGTVPEPEVVTNTETVFRDRVVTVTETVTETVEVEVAETPFAYFASGKVSRQVAENSAPGTPVGAPVTVLRNSGNNVAYSLAGADAALFSVERDSGQILVGQGTVLDFESERTAYTVEVVATPSTGAVVRTVVEIDVVDVAETATVSISPAGQPQVGQALTATLTHTGGEPADPRWQWQRSTGDGLWSGIQGATSTAYTPTERDAGRRLRAIATYGEPDGSGDGVAGAITQALAGEPYMGTAALYDANGDGRIDADEVIAAIRDYYAGDLDFGGVMEVIGVYYAG